MAGLDMFRVHWGWGLLLLFSVLFIGACGGSGSPEATATRVAPTATTASSSGGGGTLALDDALDRGIELFEELLDVLAGVTDEASARAAVDDVTRIVNQLEDLNERLGDYSDAEIASAALSGRFRSFGQQFVKEIIRLSANPAAFALLAEAFENFSPN